MKPTRVKKATGTHWVMTVKLSQAPNCRTGRLTSPHPWEPSGQLRQNTRYLICIVWTGHQQEDPGEGVLGGVGDLSGFRTWGKKVNAKITYRYSAPKPTLWSLIIWVRTGVCVCVCTWWAEIPQSNVDGKVAHLAELRKQTSSAPGPYRVKVHHFKANWLFFTEWKSNVWIYNFQ